nr:outer membrane protein porin [Tanacetum cinerariifolium]
DSENEHLKSKIVDFTTVQNLRAQVKELQSENEHLKSKVVDFTMVQTLQVQVKELKSVNESLNLMVEELSNALAHAKATLRERDELISTQCKKIQLLEEQSEIFREEKGYKVKCIDEEKKAFETKISKLEKVLAQRVKDFDDVKTELSRRTDKFVTYFVNLEKQNALLKSQLASQKYTSLQKENNDLRTSYNVLKEKYENSCENFKKDDNDLKMHYKSLFDSIKQKKVVSQVFTKSIPKVNVSEKIYTSKSSKSISKKVSQFTTYSLQKDKKCFKKQHSSETFSIQNHVKNESSKQMWKVRKTFSNGLSILGMKCFQCVKEMIRF